MVAQPTRDQLLQKDKTPRSRRGIRIALWAFCGLTLLIFLQSAVTLASLAKVSFAEGGA